MSSSNPPDNDPPAPGNKGTGKEKESLLSTVANSASGLLDSITRPTPSAVTSTLASAASSSSKSGQQQYHPSSSSSNAFSETASFRSSGLPSQSFASSSQSFPQDGRGVLSNMAEDDFTYFAEHSEPVFPNLSYGSYHPSPKQSTIDSSDGAEVAMLLSLPLATSEIYEDEITQTANSVNISHPAVVAFAECEDPVEFLQAGAEWSKYTESVWGDLLETMREVEKGKGKDDGEAADKLRKVWVQVRAKL